jgi:Flp pilus assembly pilin Flp
MKRAFMAVVRFGRDDRGQDLLEYAMLMALIAVAAIAVISATGTTIGTVFWGGIVTSVAAAF